MKTTSFIDQHAPKHQGLSEWSELMKPVQHRIFVSTTAPVPRPQTLFEFYLGGDLREILNDMEMRPEHYSERQREVIQHLAHGYQTPTPVTAQEKDDIFYQWQRQSDLSAKSKEMVSAISDARHQRERKENEEIIMDDGRSLADHQSSQESAPTPTFENQSFGDKIIV
jgi:hypothetical protein